MSIEAQRLPLVNLSRGSHTYLVRVAAKQRAYIQVFETGSPQIVMHYELAPRGVLVRLGLDTLVQRDCRQLN